MQVDIFNGLNANVKTRFTTDQGHAIPTTGYGGEAYDGIGDMLDYLYKNLKTGAITSDLKPFDSGWKDKGVLRRFSQRAFQDTEIFYNGSFDDFGGIYYPNQCFAGTKCKIHFAFHGCTQTMLEGW